MMMTRPASGTHNPAMPAIAPKCHAWQLIGTAVTRFRSILMTLMFFLLSAPALAWNFAGHRLSACIAWDQLPASSQEKVGQLLRAHPDYARWTRKAGRNADDRAAFIEASIWADLIRHDPRFHDANEAATPLLPGFPDMDRHRDWHYVNRPLTGYSATRSGEGERTGQLDTRLELLTATLGSQETSERAAMHRSYALPWLIHLVADAHQPMHVIDADAAWDAPQGDLKRLDPSAPRKRTTSLHAFWDDLPGPSGLSGTKLDSACRALTAMHPPPQPSSPAQWIDESWQIARTAGFPDDYSRERRISRAFFVNAKEIANQRIVAAGYRLADVLRKHLR